MTFDTKKFNLDIDVLTTLTLSQWLNPGKPEGLYFDFKDTNGTTIDYRDLAQTVAGMANTDGGIVFLGIPQVGGNQGPGEANPNNWHGLPNKITEENVANGIRAVFPEITLNKEIKIKGIEYAQGKKIFIITVEESQEIIKSPQKIISPTKSPSNYPLRDNNGTNQPMTPIEFHERKIEKMKPKLSPTIAFNKTETKEKNYEQIFFSVFVENNGKSCAKYATIFGNIRSDPEKVTQHRIKINPEQEITVTKERIPFRHNHEGLVYPGVPEPIFQFSSKNNEYQKFHIDVVIAAENFPVKRFGITFSAEDLIDKVDIEIPTIE